jgi:hypothetical protein
MRGRPLVILLAVVSLPFWAGCAAAPRARPVKMGPAEAGLGTIEDERHRLKGTWQLVSLQVMPASGEPLPVEAQGVLTYDDYGNLTMKGTVTASAQVDPSALNITGRAVIDPDAHTIRILDVKAPDADAARVDPAYDATKVRHYEFVGDDLLKTTVKDASGRTTATATWKRQS